MEICFPGGQRVEALHQGFWIRTDQPVSQGGGGEAPSPFDLFLASIGTCAGYYTLRFCQQRNLRTEGMALTLNAERDADRKRVVCIHIEITLPPGFPEKYREAILHAVDACSVKRHLARPPRFEVILAETPEEDSTEAKEEKQPSAERPHATRAHAARPHA
jgi:ribosomal protein S12 methylthiotransferase accessory factor